MSAILIVTASLGQASRRTRPSRRRRRRRRRRRGRAERDDEQERAHAARIQSGERDRHRRVVGERPALEHLAGAGRGRPSVNRWSTWLPATCTSPGSSGCAQVEVAAEHERRAARPRARPRRRARCRRALPPPGWLCECTFTTQPRPAAARRGPSARSGHRRSRAARGARAIGRPRTRIALLPPPHDFRRSGLRTEIARRQRQQLVARRELHALPRAGRRGELRRAPRRHLLQQRDVPLPARRARPRTRAPATARTAAPSRPWKRFQVRTRTAADRTLRRLHFLDGTELSAAPAHVAAGPRARRSRRRPPRSRALEGRTVALLFEHPSTRTRVSFEAGVFELGGHPMVLRANELQLTRGESVRDTALVFSRHAAAIGLRTGSEERLAALAEHATVPVVNMLSPRHHPCQALADLMTMREAFGVDRGPRAHLRRRRQQRRALARAGRRARRRAGARRGAGGLPARARGRRRAVRRPGRRRSPAPTPSTPTSGSR